MSPPEPWWNPERHADRRAGLLARTRIKAAIRGWFEEQGFVEIEAGALVVSPGNETHLKAFRTELTFPGGSTEPRYLHTSPEFAAKRLVAAGETMLFTFAPVFRDNERGPLHAPEFTMLEWYRAGPAADCYETIQNDCMCLLSIAATATGRTDWTWRNRTCDATAAEVVKTVHGLFADLFGIDLAANLNDATWDRDALAAAARSVDIASAADETWGDIFSKVMVEAERRYPGLPELRTPDNKERPLILDQFPAVMSPLARPSPGDPRFAGRFEVFAAGIELANGFAENNDAEQVRRRLEAEMDEKQRLYGERYPIDDDFIAALSMVPSGTAGCALGFDRLVMLATGATHIDQIIWTPIPQ
ncbi:MAG: elongation factor P--(R)-beta-lysine ligase [Alphaproteobacteria bacterium BRH_c36]|nr:MAG: elongation factor P--(R)-beta-lysine ligase [Alphaproteobacteria bacterium BRH_c36]KUO69604.1 MAG: elongation factor P--(R)-beta-lysine ligase [Alphaproteobacteria bacterium BRH_c36]